MTRWAVLEVVGLEIEMKWDYHPYRLVLQLTMVVNVENDLASYPEMAYYAFSRVLVDSRVLNWHALAVFPFLAGVLAELGALLGR
jgi:hypothetical protein